MNKAELRSLYLERRKATSGDEIQKHSLRISDRFFSSFDLSGVKYLHSYIQIAKFNEIDTLPIIERVWTEFPNIKTVAPKFDFDSGELTSIEYDGETIHLHNSWSIPEPRTGDLLDPQKIDLVIVPMLCCDRTGHRVGYGKGIYDRFLRRCRDDCKKIGLNAFEPVKRIDDVGEHDIALDYCVTPEALFSF
ncbi:MAG: 5-formyltetrahydrofolate cyclo-ligase [Acidobacteriota bacterium]